ncbi:MAG: ABC-F family ATP-binding cassette domain-containing protein [Anaerolineales bacterium]|nr:ABC-F family ATP-binding cassette domain-containing protein [Anaerolineales bacterium]
MSNLTQSFGAFDLFSGISGTVPNDGKIGLVGPNGVGKTSLIQILTGQTTAKSGAVHIAKNATVGYLQQEAMRAFHGREELSVHQEMLAIFDHLKEKAAALREMEAAMADGTADDELFETYSHELEAFELGGGYNYELRIEQVLDGLGFDRENWHTPLNHLSGGQKTRALLARLILEKPELLILDEPTNHLDVAAIEWLENTLKQWDGAVLLVSHDRYFLDRVVNTIWEMSAVHIEVYRGNYSEYVTQREERWARREKEFLSVKERFEKELDYIKRNIAGQRTQMAQGKLSRLTRDLKAIEAGGMALLNSGKSWLEMGVGSQRSMSVAEAEERIKSLPRPVYRPVVPNLRLRASHRSGNIILRTTDLRIGYPNAPLFTADDIELTRLETAALIGPNGAGKTTFLKTILNEMEPLAGEIQLGASLNVAYFSQAHEALNLENTILDELIRHRHMLISEARDYLGQYLFSGDDVFKRISTLSGGERGRLALAILALQDANFLLLDEPTNHLDVSSQELLESVLNNFDGTILMVSHDRYLIDKLATQIWAVQDGRLRVFEGNYQEYLMQRDAEQAAVKEQQVQARQEEEAAVVHDEKPQLSKNEQMRLKQAIEEIEAQITAKEAQLETVSTELQAASEAQLFDKIQSKSIEYSTLENELESLVAEWEKLVSE